MNKQIHEEWLNKISSAQKKAKNRSNLLNFKRLNKNQVAKASYFVQMADIINNLGLSNPHEKSALSIEPTHPVDQKNLDEAFDKLGIHSLLKSHHKKYKLSLISLEMLSHYSLSSDAKDLIKHGCNEELYLLDPLYGFIFIPKEKKIHNHCFAIDIWSAHLKSMPSELAKELWKNRADNMLSGGALAGRLLFKNLIPQENNPRNLVNPPVIYVNSENELKEIINELEVSVKNIPNVELWFRGQNNDYQTPERSALCQIGLVPYSNIRDSDLTPSLYRKYDNFLEDTGKFEDLIISLAEWVYYANHIISNTDTNKSFNQRGVASVNNHGLTSYQKGLLLQQYGAPSAYLDITHDFNIATWFATRKCNINEEGKMFFKEYFWNSSNSDEWPTIYIFPLVKGLHPFLDLNSILIGSGAKRPERQKCGLLGGAGNLARNYCARYIGMKIKLSPNFKLSSPFSANELFPSEAEDVVLKYLKDSGLNQNRQFPLSELG